MIKILFLFCVFHISLNQEEAVDTKIAEQLYIKLFKRQRVEQLEAIKRFKKVGTYGKQYSLIKLMAENIITVIQESRAIIESSSYIPGVSEFPLDDTIKEALSNILENTALFSEVILRFPDAVMSLFKNNNNWDVMFQWGLTFSYQMKYLLDKSTLKLLDLVSQELNYTGRDPNYINPYRKVEEQDVLTNKKENTKEKKKTLKKMPRLTKHFEL